MVISLISPSAMVRVLLIFQTLQVLILGKSIDYLWMRTWDVGPVSLRREPLQTITALATDLAPYGINIQDKTFITFQLKSCKDAFITLVDQNGNETYQFVLGAANNTVISFFTSQNAVYFDYPDGLLSCTEFKSFWLSWEDLNFKVGLGNNTSEGQILSHNETTNGMQFTGFQKIMIHTGFKENGTWIIYNEANPIGQFRVSSGFRASGNLVQSMMLRSTIECSVFCDSNDECLGYNYNKLTKECELVSGNQLISTRQENDWKFVVKCLQGKQSCINY